MTERNLETQVRETARLYHTPKTEGDIDLVQTVRDLMNAVGLGQKVITLFNTHRFIVEAEGKHSSIQRYLLNRYWNNQLMLATEPSVDVRFCLIHNGEISDWIRLFQQKVLPFAIEHNLPMVVE